MIDDDFGFEFCDACERTFWPSDLHNVKDPNGIDTFWRVCNECEPLS